MEQRDYLKDQIDQLGKVLGMLLGRLIGTAPGEDYEQVERAVQQGVKEHLGIPFTELLDTPPEDLVVRLQQHPGFTPENLEQLADIMVEIGKRESQEQIARKHYTQALNIYEYLADHSRTFSLPWLEKMDHLNKLLG
uniref:Uncharacterized protein n=1 Tax=Roseihalotalea indica TaxID=2867963 RepID=A0AA49JHD7_9BACT|nr:hypothetical protein K4G66_09105 [Tunicatimonas sp. TK19036]